MRGNVNTGNPGSEIVDGRGHTQSHWWTVVTVRLPPTLREQTIVHNRAIIATTARRSRSDLSPPRSGEKGAESAQHNKQAQCADRSVRQASIISLICRNLLLRTIKMLAGNEMFPCRILGDMCCPSLRTSITPSGRLSHILRQS